MIFFSITRTNISKFVSCYSNTSQGILQQFKKSNIRYGDIAKLLLPLKLTNATQHIKLITFHTQ